MWQHTQQLLYGHYIGQPALVGTSSKELENFVGAKFICLHALANGNQHIWIRDETPKFSSALSTLSQDTHVRTTYLKQSAFGETT